MHELLYLNVSLFVVVSVETNTYINIIIPRVKYLELKYHLWLLLKVLISLGFILYFKSFSVINKNTYGVMISRQSFHTLITGIICTILSSLICNLDTVIVALYTYDDDNEISA